MQNLGNMTICACAQVSSLERIYADGKQKYGAHQMFLHASRTMRRPTSRRPPAPTRVTTDISELAVPLTIWPLQVLLAHGSRRAHASGNQTEAGH